MSKYSKVAARRYRLYTKHNQRQYLIQRLVAFALLVLHNLARALQRAQIKKSRRVEKVTVVDLE